MGKLKDAKEKVQKVKDLLLALEKELRFFRDGSESDRNILRRELDFADIGYISSLLSMMSQEDRFERWRMLTTNRFNSFKKRPK